MRAKEGEASEPWRLQNAEASKVWLTILNQTAEPFRLRWRLSSVAERSSRYRSQSRVLVSTSSIVKSKLADIEPPAARGRGALRSFTLLDDEPDR